jgi:hypothetical protein
MKQNKLTTMIQESTDDPSGCLSIPEGIYGSGHLRISLGIIQ